MSLINILVFVGLAVVAVILFAGVFAMYRGKDSNKYMQFRVIAQGVVVLFLLLVLLWRSNH